MQDIYVPIDYSNLKHSLPSGEEIIYSTLCNAAYWSTDGTRNMTRQQFTHVLFTTNGVAYFAVKIGMLKEQLKPKFVSYDKIDIKEKIIGAGFKTGGIWFALICDTNYENQEEFSIRIRQFRPKIVEHMIKRKERWLEQNRNNPEIKKRKIKSAEKRIRKLNKMLY